MSAVGRFMGNSLTGVPARSGSRTRARASRKAAPHRPLRYRYRATRRKSRTTLNRCR